MTKRFCSKPNFIFSIVVMLILIPHVLFLLQPFFIDELAVLRNVLEFGHKQTLVPHHTNYPTFYSYIAAPFIGLGAAWHSVLGDTGNIKETVAYLYQLEPRALILPARLLSLVALTSAVVVVGSYLSQRFGKLSGYSTSAAALATPALLPYGSYGLPDATLLALCATSLILALCFLETYPRPFSRAQLWLSAFVAGLAISTKYNALASVIPIGTACVILFLSDKTDFKGMTKMILLSAAVCIGSFLVGSPGWIIAPEKMLGGLLHEVAHAKSGHVGFSGIPLLGHIELLINGDLQAREIPVLLVGSILGIACWIKNRTAPALLPLSLIVATFGSSAFTAKQSLHYLYPMFGALWYFWALGISQLQRYKRNIITAIPLVSIVALYVTSLEEGLRYLRPNTTELAADWMYQNIPEGSSVARDWAYVPRFFSADEVRKLEASVFGRMSKQIAEDIRTTYRIYDVVPLDRSPDWLRHSKAEYFITSEMAYSRFFKHGIFTGIKPDNQTALGAEFNQFKSFYMALFRSEEWVKVYSVETGNGPKTVVYRRKNKRRSLQD